MSDKIQKKNTSLWGSRWSARRIRGRREKEACPYLVSVDQEKLRSTVGQMKRTWGFVPRTSQRGLRALKCMFRHPHVPRGALRKVSHSADYGANCIYSPRLQVDI